MSANTKAPTDYQAASPDAEYKVGYKKPPTHTRFQPGQSGNPRGRPRRKHLNLAEELAEVLGELIPVREGDRVHRRSRFKTVIAGVSHHAMRGNGKALAGLLRLIEMTRVPSAPGSAPAKPKGPPTPQDLAETRELIARLHNVSDSMLTTFLESLGDDGPGLY